MASSGARPLVAVVDRSCDEFAQIESVFFKCKGHSSVWGFVDYWPTEEGCLFALWDAWTRFLRELVMVCAAGQVLGLSGALYSPLTTRSESSVLAELRSAKRGNSYKFTNQEPDWNKESSLVDIVSVLGLANASVIVGAVTASTISLGPSVVQSPLPEIRVARNFCAHKNWKTLSDVSAYSPTSFTTMNEHLREKRSGVETFSEWVECLISLTRSAAQ